MNEELITYLAQNPKYKLVFDLNSSLSVEPVDVGLYLSTALSSKLNNRRLNMYAGDAIRTMIRQHTHVDDQLGRYVALDNIGMLFEPDLSINLESVIEQTAKDELLIIRSRGVVENDSYFFLSKQYGISLNLKNINYIAI